MKPVGPFAPGMPAREPVNVAVQRPTVNLRESENLGEEMEGDVRRFSKHGTFGPKTVTHPGLE